MTNYIIKGSFVSMLAILVLGFSSCEKAKDTKARIIIKNVANEVVAGASVRLYGNPSIPTTAEVRVDLTEITDGSGIATFDLTEFYERGQVGLGVLDVFAVDSSSTPAIVASGVIKVEEEVENEKTFIAE